MADCFAKELCCVVSERQISLNKLWPKTKNTGHCGFVQALSLEMTNGLSCCLNFFCCLFTFIPEPVRTLSTRGHKHTRRRCNTVVTTCSKRVFSSRLCP